MSTLTAIFSVLLLVFSIAVTIVVILQEGNENGLSGAIGGGSSDSFLSKNKSRTMDAFLNKWTKFIAVGFFIIALVCDLLAFANL